MLRNFAIGILLAASPFASTVGTVVEVRPPSPFSYVGVACTTTDAPTSVTTEGATVAMASNSSFTSGSSCTVIPPADVPASVALRCTVAPGVVTITASTGLTFGTTAPAGSWCVEVRTVATEQ